MGVRMLQRFFRCGLVRRKFGALVIRLQKARVAFTASEFNYHLELRAIGIFNVAYRKDTADEHVLAHSFEHDIFLKGMPEYKPQPHHIVIDVGAHIGTFTMLIAPRVRRVYAVEASEETYNYLQVNCLLNRLDNVVVSCLAIGDENRTAFLYHSDAGNWGNTIMHKSGRGAELVTMATLESYMRLHRITRCDLLRMNCEGAEFPVLLSTKPEILGTIDRMLILYHCDLVKDASLDELKLHLRHSGFDVTIRNRSDERGWLIATRASTPGTIASGSHETGHVR